MIRSDGHDDGESEKPLVVAAQKQVLKGLAKLSISLMS